MAYYEVAPSGKPYTDIRTAIGDASEGETIYIYPGTYIVSSLYVNKWVNLKGVSNNPEDIEIIITNDYSLGFSMSGDYGTPIYVEGLYFRRPNDDDDWMGTFSSSTGTGTLIFNRCYFRSRHALWKNASTPNLTEIYKNCWINGLNANSFRSYSESNSDLHLDQCVVNGTFESNTNRATNTYTRGNPTTDNYVYNYGNYYLSMGPNTSDNPQISYNNNYINIEPIPDSIIYYTLDGSDPTPSSQIYTDPIPYDTGTLVKAISKHNTKDYSGISSKFCLWNNIRMVPDYVSSINNAIRLSSDGETVCIRPGTYNENVSLYKWVNLKGIVDGNNNVIVEQPGSSSFTARNNYDGTIYVETIEFRNPTSYCFSFSSGVYDNFGHLFFNKVFFNANVGGEICQSFYGDNGSDRRYCSNDIKLTYQNCYLNTHTFGGRTFSGFYGNNYYCYDNRYWGYNQADVKPTEDLRSAAYQEAAGIGHEYGINYLPSGDNSSNDPIISIEDGHVVIETDINLGTPTFYYTIDGSEPTIDSTEYIEPIPIAYSFPIKVMCRQPGKEQSGISGQYIRYNNTVIVPDHITNLRDAFRLVENGDTILLQPGLYKTANNDLERNSFYCYKWVNIKGNSTNPEDVQIHLRNWFSSGHKYLYYHPQGSYDGTVYLEGFTISDEESTYTGHAFNFGSGILDNSGEIICNRLNIGAQSDFYGDNGSDSRRCSNDIRLEFRNCNANPGSYFNWYFSGSNYHFIKSIRGTFNRSVNPDTDDVAPLGTEGYGYEYGEWYLDFGPFDFSSIDKKTLLLGDSWQDITDSRILTSPPASNATEFEEEIL